MLSEKTKVLFNETSRKNDKYAVQLGHYKLLNMPVQPKLIRNQLNTESKIL